MADMVSECRGVAYLARIEQVLDSQPKNGQEHQKECDLLPLHAPALLMGSILVRSRRLEFRSRIVPGKDDSTLMALHRIVLNVATSWAHHHSTGGFIRTGHQSHLLPPEKKGLSGAMSLSFGMAALPAAQGNAMSLAFLYSFG